METTTLRVSQILDPKFLLRPVEKYTDKYKGLKASIKAYGVMQPISVRPAPKREGYYEALNGFHRLTACRELRMRTIPALIRYDILTDAEVLAFQIQTQTHTVEPKATEYAAHIRKLKDLHPNWTLEQLAATLRVTKLWLYRVLQLTNLDPKIQTLVDAGDIKIHNAYLLSTIPRHLQRKAVVAAGTMDVPGFRSFVAQLKRSHYQEARVGPYMPDIYLRPASQIAMERRHNTHLTQLIARLNIKTPLEAANAALDWALSLDPITVEERREKVARRMLYPRKRTEENDVE